jgi:AcrR family transcriptional regulator
MEKTERKEREYNLRRAEILNHAEEVFAAKGFYKATIAEIADASGFAVGTLYQFFESKEKLFSSMVTEKLEIFYGEIKNAVAGKENAIEKIRALVNANFCFVENNVNFCAILIRREGNSLTEGSNTLRNQMIADYLEYIAFIETIMLEGVEAKILRGKNHRLMAFALTGMINAYTFSWINAPRTGSLADMNEILLDIFLGGVRSNGV